MRYQYSRFRAAPHLSGLLCVIAGLLATGLAAAGEPGPKHYRARRAALLERTGDGVVLLHGAGHRHGRFRQDNNFYYLTGVDTPGAALLLRGGDVPFEILFLPERDTGSERWIGRIHSYSDDGAYLDDVRSGTGFPRIQSIDSLAGALQRTAFPVRNPAPALVYYFRPGNLDDEPGPALRFLDTFRRNFPSVRVDSLAPALDRMRQIKDPKEVRLLQRAIDITGAALGEVFKELRPGMHEYELEGTIIGTFRRHGARGPGFPSIIASGESSTILHYNRNTRRMSRGELVLLDIGAEFDYYTADISRTLPVSGTFSARQRELYTIVLNAQEAAIQAVRPGATLGEIHEAAVGVLDRAGYKEFFIHKTSHFLGMAVHDVGDSKAPLEPGMVITVEPGLYIPDEKLGIRIEDDVLVTERGRSVLSSHIPKRIEDLERLLRRGRN